MFPFVLYLLAGLGTGFSALRRLLWVVWGAPIHPVPLLAFAGSLTLIGAAVISLTRPRLAARLALLATVPIWSFYVVALVSPFETITGDIPDKPDPTMDVLFVQWKPGPEPLKVTSCWPEDGLTNEELDQLKATGLRGRLTIVTHSPPATDKRNRAVVVMHRQLDSAVELFQPDRTTVIYVQEGSDWRKIPFGARTARQMISLEIATHTPAHTWYYVTLMNGAREGGTAFRWDEPPPTC